MAPLYDYKAVTPDGKNTRGIVESENQKAARLKLKKQGLMVTMINEKFAANPTSSGGVPFFAGRVSSAEIAGVTRQLASLIKANVPLVESLKALVDQIEKPAFRVVVDQVRQDVNEGLSLAKALAKHGNIFDNIFVNMVEAGESSGTLGLVLLKLADLKEAQMRLRSKVISGMTYPVLMMSVAMVLMIVIFTFVIPKLVKVFESMKKALPPSTKFLIFVSDTVVNWWYLLALVAGLCIYMFLKFIKSPTGQPKWDRFTLKVPIFGPLTRMIAVTRFASTMSTLLASGVPILNALSITQKLVGSIPIANAVATARENITEGQSIADPLRRSGEFPPMVIHMIAIGEKTGELPEMLKNVAEGYEEQINTKIEGLTALMEPLMIIGMGGVVAFIVMSIFVPLLEISNINGS